MEPTDLQSTAPGNWRRTLLFTSLGLLLTATSSLSVVGAGSPTTHVANRSVKHRALSPLDVPDEALVAGDDEGDTTTTELPRTTTTARVTTSTTFHGDSVVSVPPVPDVDNWPEDPDVTPDPLIVQFPLGKKSYPYSIAEGSDGALWFTESNGKRIGRVTTEGEVTEYGLAEPLLGAQTIVAGPDGALWFTAPPTHVGRITVDGNITTYDTGYMPYFGMTAGPDGALWFTAYKDGVPGHLVRITTAGAVTAFEFGTMVRDVAVGPDGNLWTSDPNALWRVTPTGTATKFPITEFGDGYTQCITAGPDGALWFGFNTASKAYLVRRAANGDLKSFEVPNGINAALVVGPDGNFWATSWGTQIMRITPNGEVGTFDLYRSSGLAVGPDGNIWFTNDLGGQVGRVNLGAL